MPRLQGRNASTISGILVALATCGYACVRTPPNVKATDVVTPAAAPAAPSGLHFDVSALNRSVDPCSDFYDFACGGWRATHAIPPDRVRWSRYAEITRENMDRERTIVDAARQAQPARRPRSASRRSTVPAWMKRGWRSGGWLRYVSSSVGSTAFAPRRRPWR